MFVMPTPPPPAVMVAPHELYDKYIYVQTLVSPQHNLSKHSLTVVKSEARAICHESLYVKEQLMFDIANEMVYTFKDFHAHPHGSGQQTEKGLDDKHFVCFGNNGSGTLMEHIYKNCVFEYSHDKVKIAYRGSNDLQQFQNLNINKLGLLRAAWITETLWPVETAKSLVFQLQNF
jgi:hypothetical protein